MRKGCSFLRREGKRKGKREEKESAWWIYAGREILASVMGILCLLGVGAALIAGGVLGQRCAEGIVLAGCGLGVFIGMSLAGRGRRGGVAASLTVALGVVAFLILTGLFLYRDLVPERCVAMAMACLCGGGLAGVLGQGKTKTHKRRER